MVKKPLQIFFVPLAALLLGQAPLAAQSPAALVEAEHDVRLVDIKGEVIVYSASDPNGGPADEGMPLSLGDRIKAGEDSSATLVFSGMHSVGLRPSSELTLSSVKKNDSELKLSGGGLLASIQALAGGSFRVRTPAAVAAVRGTQFAVEIAAENPDETHVGVFDEGKVEVQGQSGAPELLITNQETHVLKGSPPLAAYQLRRFMRNRQSMRSLHRRAALMRKTWRALAPQRRQELRREWQERAQRWRQKARERKPALEQRGPRPVKRLRKDQEKMLERKKAIRERLRRGTP
ncbi:MAG: FecR family protein [Elusimicrobiota bacterium]